MHNFLIALFTFISSLSFSPTIAPANVTVVATPEVIENSILSYYYAVPSQYFIKVKDENNQEHELIMKTAEERKAALDKLIEDEQMGKNKELFSGENKEYKENNSDNMLAVVDEENYYLRMNPNESYGDWSQDFEMTVFIKSNNEHVIAVESHDCGLSCSPESTTFFLLTYKDGKWSDVTKELLPVKEIDNFVQTEIKTCEKINAKNGDRENDKQEIHNHCVNNRAGIAYSLPEIGTTIFAYNGLSETKFKLAWKNDKFEFEVAEKKN